MSIDTDYDEFLDEVFLENDRLRKEVQDLKKDFITTVSHRAIVNAIKEERDQLKSQNAEQAREIERLTALDYAKEDQRRADGLIQAQARVVELETALKFYQELCEERDTEKISAEGGHIARQALESGGK